MTRSEANAFCVSLKGGTFDKASFDLLVSASTSSPFSGLGGTWGWGSGSFTGAHCWVLKAQTPGLALDLLIRVSGWGCVSSIHAYRTCWWWGWDRPYVENYTVDASIYIASVASFWGCWCGVGLNIASVIDLSGLVVLVVFFLNLLM